MVGPTAQIVALACHCNAFARGLKSHSFFPSNSTAKFCEYIRFMHLQRRWFGQPWKTTALTTDEWIKREGSPGQKAVVSYQSVNAPEISDRMSAGFIGGGGQWRLNVMCNGRKNVWEPMWEVGDRNAPDQRVWRVTYMLAAENIEANDDRLEQLETIIPVLNQTFSDVLVFCSDHRLDSFSGFFRRATECLTANDALALVNHQDLAPEGLLSVAAERVLAACQAAWVFGGMGSWNDMGFTGHEQSRYERLSDRLFAELNNAIVVATNSVNE
jgi:hypothetical protein